MKNPYDHAVVEATTLSGDDVVPGGGASNSGIVYVGKVADVQTFYIQGTDGDGALTGDKLTAQR